MGPECSVIIPVYNGEEHIKETVESVLNQTYKDFELIIIDDGSVDGSLNLINELAERDGRIKILKNEKNRGVAYTRNRGMGAAEGKYVALLDSDDLWLPEKLERQVCFMNEKKCRLSYCSYGFIDQDGKNLGKDFHVPPQTDLVHLLKKNVISCSTVIGERELFLNHRFREDFYHEDFVEWIDLLQECKKSYGITGELAKIRIMKGTRSAGKANSARQRWLIYREYMGMGTLKATYYFVNYAILSMLKYRTLRKGLVK